MGVKDNLNSVLKTHTEIVRENTEVQKMLIRAIEKNNKKNLIASTINALLNATVQSNVEATKECTKHMKEQLNKPNEFVDKLKWADANIFSTLQDLIFPVGLWNIDIDS